MTQKNLKTLGALEAEIMEIIWANGQASVRLVLNELQKTRSVAYTTVMTVMGRLYAKKILTRKLDKSGAFMYAPTLDKKTFLAKVSEKIIKNFLTEYGDVAVAQFVDIIEAGNSKQSKEWKNKLRSLLKK